MKNNITELVFILDKSGSMAGLESDTIGGFNSMIEKQKKEEGKALVSTYSFNHENNLIHDRLDLGQVNKLTDKDYVASGTTALIDAMGEAISHIEMIHKYARKEDVPENVMFIITTDGFENSSSKYTSDQVKKMVSAKKDLGWKFIFLGANIDAVETAKQYGIDKEMAVTYTNDSDGIDLNFEAITSAISNTRRSGKIDTNWSAKIKNRKNK